MTRDDLLSDLLLSILITLSVFSALLYINPDILFSPLFLSAFDILLNVVLIGALIFIYLRMASAQKTQASETVRQTNLQEEVSKIQQQQAELMHSQQELSKRTERPLLQVEGYRPAEPDNSRYSTSALELKVSNLGRTPGMDLKVEFITGFPRDVPLSSGRNTISIRRKSADEQWFSEWGENIEATEQGVIYIGEPLMMVWHNEEKAQTKQRALEFMKSRDDDFENIEYIRIKASLVYKGLDDEYREPIFDYLASLESYGGMRAALEHGRRYNDSMEYKISSEIHEFDQW
ncbi:hypothetical protein [Halalkalicoccus subterraneus]|uniref:hypothetical protein n=1 Tax=Halalkalicoccus subterraneus TaxID=2675002 RepID=UPI0013CE9369|nr:hypothetical protein [Halalkalicoccus subterraneus]